MVAKNQATFPLFVYFYKEPPGKDQDVLYKANEKFANLFNITYTYRRDSVVPFVYGKVLPKTPVEDGNSALQDMSIINWKSMPNEIPSSIINRDISHKTKGILWMVSHCTTESRREDYVKKLQRHLNEIDSTLSIDILGKCGKDELPKSNTDGERLGNTRLFYIHEFIKFNSYYLYKLTLGLIFFQTNKFISVKKCIKTP